LYDQSLQAHDCDQSIEGIGVSVGCEECDVIKFFIEYMPPNFTLCLFLKCYLDFMDHGSVKHDRNSTYVHSILRF
jgi:hypothetical protein